MSRIDRIIEQSAPHERAAILAYRYALNNRRDWHMAVKPDTSTCTVIIAASWAGFP